MSKDQESQLHHLSEEETEAMLLTHFFQQEPRAGNNSSALGASHPKLRG